QVGAVLVLEGGANGHRLVVAAGTDVVCAPRHGVGQLGIGGERRLGSEGGGGKNAADHGEADLHGMSPLVCLGPGQPGLMQCQASSATMLAPAHMPFALGHSDGRRASATTDRGNNRTKD